MCADQAAIGTDPDAGGSRSRFQDRNGPGRAAPRQQPTGSPGASRSAVLDEPADPPRAIDRRCFRTCRASGRSAEDPSRGSAGTGRPGKGRRQSARVSPWANAVRLAAASASRASIRDPPRLAAQPGWASGATPRSSCKLRGEATPRPPDRIDDDASPATGAKLPGTLSGPKADRCAAAADGPASRESNSRQAKRSTNARSIPSARRRDAADRRPNPPWHPRCRRPEWVGFAGVRHCVRCSGRVMLRFLPPSFASQTNGGGGAPPGDQGWRHHRCRSG